MPGKKKVSSAFKAVSAIRNQKLAHDRTQQEALDRSRKQAKQEIPSFVRLLQNVEEKLDAEIVAAVERDVSTIEFWVGATSRRSLLELVHSTVESKSCLYPIAMLAFSSNKSARVVFEKTLRAHVMRRYDGEVYYVTEDDNSSLLHYIVRHRLVWGESRRRWAQNPSARDATSKS